MMRSIKPLLLLASLSVAFGTQAVQKDITVTASIDSQLEMTKADGTDLPNDIEMIYKPGLNKLDDYQQMVKIWSNEIRAINVRLTADVKLYNGIDTQIPLTVKLANRTLSPSDQTIMYSEIFPNSSLVSSTGSNPLLLNIAQDLTMPMSIPAGSYSGTVSIVVTPAAL